MIFDEDMSGLLRLTRLSLADHSCPATDHSQRHAPSTCCNSAGGAAATCCNSSDHGGPLLYLKTGEQLEKLSEVLPGRVANQLKVLKSFDNVIMFCYCLPQLPHNHLSTINSTSPDMEDRGSGVEHCLSQEHCCSHQYGSETSQHCQSEKSETSQHLHPEPSHVAKMNQHRRSSALIEAIAGQIFSSASKFLSDISLASGYMLKVRKPLCNLPENDRVSNCLSQIRSHLKICPEQSVIVRGPESCGKSCLLSSVVQRAGDWLPETNSILYWKLTEEVLISPGLGAGSHRDDCHRFGGNRVVLSSVDLLLFLRQLAGNENTEKTVVVIDDIDKMCRFSPVLEGHDHSETDERLAAAIASLPNSTFIMSITVPEGEENSEKWREVSVVERLKHSSLTVDIPPASSAELIQHFADQLDTSRPDVTNDSVRLGNVSQLISSSSNPHSVLCSGHLLTRLGADWNSLVPPTSHQELIDRVLTEAEGRSGADLTCVCQWLSASANGLPEHQLQHLLSLDRCSEGAGEVREDPESSSIPCSAGSDTGKTCTVCDHVRNIDSAETRWALVKYLLGPLIKFERSASSIICSWANRTTLTRARYHVNRERPNAASTEICQLNLTLLLLCLDKINNNDEAECPNYHQMKIDEVFYITETLWYNSIISGELDTLKKSLFFNFSWLRFTVQYRSAEYLLHLLALTLHWFVDWELHVLSKAFSHCQVVGEFWHSQLPCQLLIWLQHLASPESAGGLTALMSTIVQRCQHEPEPLIFPATVWLKNSLPDTVSEILLSGTRLRIASSANDHVHVFTSEGDCSFQLRHIKQGKVVHSFTGHTGNVLAVSASPDGAFIASGGTDCRVLVWSVPQRKLITQIDRHIAPVLCVSVAVGVRDCDVLVVSGAEDSCLYVSQVSLASSHTTAVTCECHQLCQHRGPITCIFINSTTGVIASGSSDKSVTLWSLQSLSLLNTIPVPCAVRFMAVAGGVTYLLTAGSGTLVHVNSFATGSVLHDLSSQQSPVTALVCSAEGTLAVVACQDKHVRVYDIGSGRVLRTLTHHRSAVIGAVFFDQYRLLATIDDRMFLLTHTYPLISKPRYYLSGRKRLSLEHENNITCMHLSSDKTMLITGSRDWLLKIWLTGTGELYASLEGHQAAVCCARFSNSCLFAVSGAADHSVRVWGLTLTMSVSAFTGHSHPVCDLALMEDSSRCISLDSGGNLLLWLIESGTVLFSERCGGNCIVSAANSSHLITASTTTDHITLWSVDEEMTPRQVSHSQTIRCHVVCGRGHWVVTGSDDTSLKVWAVADGKLLQVLVGHQSGVSCVGAAANTTEVIASGGDSGEVLIWNLDTGEVQQTLSGHSKQVVDVKFTHDSRTLVSASRAGLVLVHYCGSGHVITSTFLHLPIKQLDISQDATRIMAIFESCRYVAVLCFLNAPLSSNAEVVARSDSLFRLSDITGSPKRNESSKQSPSPIGARTPVQVRRRLLKKGVSLDTYTWQRRHGGLLGMVTPVSPGKSDKSKKKFFDEEVKMSPVGGVVHTSEDIQKQWRSRDVSLICEPNKTSIVTPLKLKMLQRSKTVRVLRSKCLDSPTSLPAGFDELPGNLLQFSNRSRLRDMYSSTPSDQFVQSKFCSIA